MLTSSSTVISRLATLVALVAAAALSASVLTAWAGVRDAASILALGDAQRTFALVGGRLDALARRPTEGELDEIRATFADDGLRYIGIRDPEGMVTTSGGVAGMRAPLPHPGELEVVGEGLVRLAGPLPHPPLSAPPSDARPPEREPRLVLEVETPTMAALESRASVTLGVGLAAALLLLLAAYLLSRAAKDREMALAEAERARHLSALGEMSAVLAHEIRNPLASLKGHAQLLEESLSEGGDERAQATRVVHEATRIERLTEDLLRFVRSGTITRTATPLAAFMKTLRERAPRLEVTLGPAPESLPMDAERLLGALENLIRNAETAQNGTTPKAVALEVRGDEAGVTFFVRDRGAGIAPGQENVIFSPFHTTRAQGTGLGLAIARRIAEAHGGTLLGRNRADGGAEFVLWVPAKR